MRRSIVIVISLFVAALAAGGFYAHAEQKRAAFVDQLADVYETTCEGKAGAPLPSECIREVPITKVLAEKAELAHVLVGQRIRVAYVSPLSRDLQPGALLTDMDFDRAHRPIPPGMRLMTVAVEADRVPGGVDPEARVDVYAPALGLGGTGRLLLGDLEVLEINGRVFTTGDDEERIIERLTLIVPEAQAPLLAAESRVLVIALSRQAPGAIGVGR